MSVCIHDIGCACHLVALSSSVCEGWPEQQYYAEVTIASKSRRQQDFHGIDDRPGEALQFSAI